MTHNAGTEKDSWSWLEDKFFDKWMVEHSGELK